MSNLKNNLGAVKLIARKKIADARGWFLKTLTGTEENLPPRTGEIYATCGNVGQSKGGHFHPKAKEWFTLLCGSVRAELADVKTGERMEILLSENDPQTLFIPANVAHIFHNCGNAPFILLAYTDELYDPEDTKKYDFSKQ